ncbi:acetylxylan esterase [candidate division KSB1 bacterium]|nr:acetylxylan esterase [candidate division KSB1 bacterium]
MSYYNQNISKDVNLSIEWILILICISCFAFASADQNQLSIEDGWKMKKGDNADWIKPDFDDSGWKPIQVGKTWENAGYSEYDGYAWYRIRFIIPKRAFKGLKHDFLSISLGFIDDVDVTYFNGEEIGKSGAFPPEYATAYYNERKYRIFKSLIRWDQENVIAVRMYDGHGEGGLYMGPYIIKVPGIAEMLDVNFDLENSDGIYHSPDLLPVTLSIQNHSGENNQVIYECTLKSDCVDKELIFNSKKRIVQITGENELTEVYKFYPPSPGFYRIVTTLSDTNGSKITKSIMLGYDPEKIKTEITREDNFEDFWRERKQELGRVDPAFKMIRSDMSTDEVDVYLVEMRSYGNVRIRGWYTVPKNDGPHAAILSVPGYTGTMWPYVNRTNVATFALNPRGHGNSKDDIDPKGSEYMFLGFDPEHPEKYIYAGAYLDCIRAIDFLFSRPEIDKSRIGVEGGSQGGGLSFATAALDQRIMFCAPDIPWLGDWIGYFEAAIWSGENYAKLAESYPGLTPSDINRLLSYFDTMNLANRIRCPVFMSVGLQDEVCPPRNAFATYNQVSSDKEYRVYPFSGHGLGSEHYTLKNKWMAERLGVEEVGL